MPVFFRGGSKIHIGIGNVLHRKMISTYHLCSNVSHLSEARIVLSFPIKLFSL